MHHVERRHRTRRSGVARRWRIRHKLLLGLATAIAILVLFLAGTLNGLWSYYVTMKAIDSKLNELNKAETFKDKIAQLAIKDNPEAFLKHVYELEDSRIAHAEKALDHFAEAFQTTLGRD